MVALPWLLSPLERISKRWKIVKQVKCSLREEYEQIDTWWVQEQLQLWEVQIIYKGLLGLCFPLTNHCALTVYLICLRAHVCAYPLAQVNFNFRVSGKLAKLIMIWRPFPRGNFLCLCNLGGLPDTKNEKYVTSLFFP